MESYIVYAKPEGTSECKAKIRIDMEIDGLGSRHEEFGCCLWAPHPLYKHMNPRIQATIGGDRWTDDPEWSYYLEKAPSDSSPRIFSPVYDQEWDKSNRELRRRRK